MLGLVKKEAMVQHIVTIEPILTERELGNRRDESVHVFVLREKQLQRSVFDEASGFRLERGHTVERSF